MVQIYESGISPASRFRGWCARLFGRKIVIESADGTSTSYDWRDTRYVSAMTIYTEPAPANPDLLCKISGFKTR